MTDSIAGGTDVCATAPSPPACLSGRSRRALAQEAEGYRVALNAGLVAPAEVAAWAESAIRILGLGDASLHSLAAAGSFPVDIVSRLLGRVSGPRNTGQAVADVLFAMYEQLERTPAQAMQVAAGLDRLAASGLAPDLAGEAETRAFATRLQSAGEGSYSSSAHLTAELRDFLGRHLPPSALARRAVAEERTGAR